MTLIQVVEFYEEKVVEMRQNEINEDFCCKNDVPSKVMRYRGILSHAIKVYTITLFKMFEEEFNLGGGLSCVETNHHENNFTYSLYKEMSSRVYTMHFNRSELTICCDYKLFETLGLLYCHALRVFLVNNVNKIPDTYIYIYIYISQFDRQKMQKRDCVVMMIFPNQKEIKSYIVYEHVNSFGI